MLDNITYASPSIFHDALESNGADIDILVDTQHFKLVKIYKTNIEENIYL